MSFELPKSVRLRTHRQYQRIAQNSKRFAGYWIVIDSRKTNNHTTKLGITVTRRYGKAHDRNRFKRLVREAFRHCRLNLTTSLDINVRPRASAKEAKMQDILDEMVKLIGRRGAAGVASSQ